MAGDWGMVVIGRQKNPFIESLHAGTEADMIHATSYVSALRLATGSVMMADPAYVGGEQIGMPYRIGNAITYASPDWSGFNFVVTATADEARNIALHNTVVPINNKSRTFDMYIAALNYVHESGFYAKAAYLGSTLFDDTKRANTYGVNVGYLGEQLIVNVAFGGGLRGKNRTSAAKVSSTGWDIGSSYAFGANNANSIHASYGQSKVNYKDILDSTTSSTYKNRDKMTVWGVDFEHKLSSRTNIWVEVARTESNNKRGNMIGTANNKFKNNIYSVGIRHDF